MVEQNKALPSAEVPIILHKADEQSEVLICHITCPNSDLATKIASALVTGDLCACVNIIPGVKSVYKWEGKVEIDEEVLCVVKTTRSCFHRMAAKV